MQPKETKTITFYLRGYEAKEYITEYNVVIIYNVNRTKQLWRFYIKVRIYNPSLKWTRDFLEYTKDELNYMYNLNDDYRMIIGLRNFTPIPTPVKIKIFGDFTLVDINTGVQFKTLTSIVPGNNTLYLNMLAIFNKDNLLNIVGTDIEIARGEIRCIANGKYKQQPLILTMTGSFPGIYFPEVCCCSNNLV